MPILTSTPIKQIDQAEFSDIAYKVIGCAHDIHNQRGSSFDEIIYQQDLASKVIKLYPGGTIETEAKIDVIWKSFSKSYYIDLIVNRSGIFELKSYRRLGPSHEAQLTHYLFLTGLQHGLLLNFGSPRIEHRFVNATITPERRKDYLVDDHDWSLVTNQCTQFRQHLTEILSEWGTGLEIPLYQEAIVHFLGGEARVVHNIPIFSLAQPKESIAHQYACLLSPQTAFKITALRDIRTFEKNAIKWLRNTHLKFLQWVNITPFEVSYTTLSQ